MKSRRSNSNYSFLSFSFVNSTYLQAVKASGVQLGRPKLDNDKVKTALKLYDSGDYSVKEIMAQVGISQGKLYKEINKRKIQSAQ